MKRLQSIWSSLILSSQKQRECEGWAGWRSLAIHYSYVTCKMMTAMLWKRGLGFPLAQHKIPCQVCDWLSYVISLSLFSIIRRWLLIRRRSTLCQRVYTCPQCAVTSASVVVISDRMCSPGQTGCNAEVHFIPPLGTGSQSASRRRYFNDKYTDPLHPEKPRGPAVLYKCLDSI